MPGGVIGGSVIGYRSAVAVYQGPGDVVAGATQWWGLRAYSNATIGNNAVRLRRSSDNAESDFVTVDDGGLDLEAITTFKGAANLFVVKLYDQTGGGFDASESTASAQPAFTLSGLGSLPIMSIGNSQDLQITPQFAQTRPFTLVAVAERTGFFTTFQNIMRTNDNLVSLNFSAVADQVNVDSTVVATAADSAYHSVIGDYNATARKIYVDAAVTSGTAGTQDISSGGTFFIFLVFNATESANAVEFGVWPFSLSAGQASSMSSNQHSYWGF
jgi:hypothetical protein